MKIYTKSGDDGSTLLLAEAGYQKLISDRSLRNSWWTKFFCWLGSSQFAKRFCPKSTLNTIQNTLFVVGALLATNPDKGQKVSTNPLNPWTLLTSKNKLTHGCWIAPLRNFILPAGSSAIATCHIARCVCRRAERNTVALAAHEPVEPLVIEYLNRLSDYLFTLARYIAHTTNTPETHG